METAVVTTKGQVVIPARIRRRYQIKEGTRICFLDREREVAIRPLTDAYIDSLRGSLRTGGRVLKAFLAEKRRERRRENGKAGGR